MTGTETLWKVPLRADEVPEGGTHRDLQADAATRAAVARAAGLVELPRLAAHFEIRRRGADELQVTGTVSASVVQTCVVTLEPVTNPVEEAVDVRFAPPSDKPPPEPDPDVDPSELPDPPEALVDGTVDLGALAVEFLLLGLDPYPRKPDAVFSAPAAEEPSASPFAALAALKGKPEKES